MLDECLMTDDCPGYDRERRVCLIRPDDCDFAPAERDAVRVVDGGGHSAPGGAGDDPSRPE